MLLWLRQPPQQAAIRLGPPAGLVLLGVVLRLGQAGNSRADRKAAGGLSRVQRRDAVGRDHRRQRPVTLQPPAAVSRLELSVLAWLILLRGSFSHTATCETRFLPSRFVLRPAPTKHQKMARGWPQPGSLNKEIELRLPVCAANRR